MDKRKVSPGATLHVLEAILKTKPTGPRHELPLDEDTLHHGTTTGTFSLRVNLPFQQICRHFIINIYYTIPIDSVPLIGFGVALTKEYVTQMPIAT